MTVRKKLRAAMHDSEDVLYFKKSTAPTAFYGA